MLPGSRGAVERGELGVAYARPALAVRDWSRAAGRARRMMRINGDIGRRDSVCRVSQPDIPGDDREHPDPRIPSAPRPSRPGYPPRTMKTRRRVPGAEAGQRSRLSPHGLNVKATCARVPAVRCGAFPRPEPRDVLSGVRAEGGTRSSRRTPDRHSEWRHFRFYLTYARAAASLAILPPEVVTTRSITRILTPSLTPC